jgi:formylglycine-generating enzyme required for sulfatase activity
MLRSACLLVLLVLAGCSSSASPTRDAATIEIEGLVFRQISPAKLGRPDPDFFLLETEVTNWMYARFLTDTKGRKIEEPEAEPDTPEMKKLREEGWSSTADAAFRADNRSLLWKDNRPPAENGEYPVGLLNIHEAASYCAWLTQRHPELGTFRLPSVDEWLLAAYGVGRACPWGDTPDTSRARVQSVTPEEVHARPEGRSPEGLYGLWGNLSEYVIHPQDVRNSIFVGVGAQWMGGSFEQSLPRPRQDYWGYWHSSNGRSQAIGFRVLLDPSDRDHRYRHQSPDDRERH